MKRKLVRQAGSAYTITLPISWIRERNLNAGDEIDISFREKDLVISTDNSIHRTSLNMSVKGFPHFGTRYGYIAAAYCRGIDELNVELDEDVFPQLSEYVGYVITDHNKTSMKIQDVQGGGQEDISQLFKRTFQIILRYYTQATSDISGEQKYSYEQIRAIDCEINKLAFFLQRSVMKKTMESSSQGKLLFGFAYALEKIGDEILRMWRLITEEKVILPNKIYELFAIVRLVLEKSFALYYRFDRNLILELRDLKEKYRALAYPLFGKDKSSSLLLMFLTRIFDDCYDLMHLSLMNEFKPQS